MILRLRPTLANLRCFSITYLICTWFHAGRIRPASGTWGSLAALPVCWAVKALAGLPGLVIFAIAVWFAGIKAIAIYLQHSDTKDPSEIVIDEVLGMAIVFLAIPLHDGIMIAAGFVLFRLLDSLKPFPIGWFDRHVKGAAGVMIDDVAAGVIAAAVLYAFQALAA